MKDLPTQSVSPRKSERNETAIAITTKPMGKLNSKEEALQLRSRLLQMILENERSRRMSPPASKV